MDFLKLSLLNGYFIGGIPIYCGENYWLCRPYHNSTAIFPSWHLPPGLAQRIWESWRVAGREPKGTSWMWCGIWSDWYNFYIHQNPSKSIKIHQNPSKSIKIHQNPSKSIKLSWALKRIHEAHLIFHSWFKWIWKTRRTCRSVPLVSPMVV